MPPKKSKDPAEPSSGGGAESPPSSAPGAALGVPLSRLKHMGGYSPTSTVPEDKYIDPSCPPSPAGRHFFGWLLPSALPLSA